jgi:hypothetical protein
MKARPISEWNEDVGDALWWSFPIMEPPYLGSPLTAGYTVEVSIAVVDGGQTVRQLVGGWPGYHTHWTPIEIPDDPQS